MSPHSSFFKKLEKDLTSCSRCRSVLEELEKKRKDGKSFAMNLVFNSTYEEFHLLPSYRCVACGKTVENAGTYKLPTKRKPKAKP